MRHTVIIAEAGVNHNGDIKIAKKLVDIAKDAGADYVKFQTFKADNLAVKNAKKADYQIKNAQLKNETQFDMLKRLELTQNMHYEIIAYCREKNIKFLSTAFDLDSLDFLNDIGIDVYKIPSGEITNFPYLRKIGEMGKPIIISTGMSDIAEIENALIALTKSGTSTEDITVLHCNTAYPTPYQDVNLKAMLHIQKELDVQVGYSDHTLGIEVPIAAVALGAAIIEKHFTLDRNLPGPDHKASLEPNELKAMVAAIRNIERAISGNGIKEPSRSELKNKDVARKSIVASKHIQKGDLFTEDNLTVKRPGIGISPMKWNEILGLPAKRNFASDDLIEL